jgi:5'(3')-deoxyribonucleotidase
VSRRPVILLDVDGPLTAGFFDRFCELLRCEGISTAYPHLITDWDVCYSFAVPDTVATRTYDRMREPGVCLAFEPNEGAVEFVNNLRRWADVLAVTAPLNKSPTWAQEREVWLTERLDFKVDEIISARNKTHVFGDILVDDKAKTIRAWSERWPGSEAILWSGSHNVCEAWYPRAGDYFDLLGLLAPLKERCR